MTPGRSLPRPPWGAVLAGLTGLVLVLGTLPLGDPDTLWHILLGQRLAQTWDFVGPAPRPGLLSGDYVYTQWLPELVAAAGYAVWGLPGVAVLAAFARLAFVAWLYRTARREAGPLASLVVLVLTLGATLGALSARPQLVGVLLLGVVATAWRATALDGRPRWWLVPVMWIWGASHGTWIVGVAVGALALALLVLRTRTWTRGPAVVWLLGALVPWCTPVPPAEVVHGFLAVRDISWFAEEWRPATWDSPQLLPFLALVGWTGLGWAFARRQGGHRPTLVDVSFLGVAILRAAPAYRGIALGAVVLAPVAAAAWGPATGVARPERPDPPDRVERVALALPLAAAAVWTLLAAPGMAASPARVPSALSEPLRALPAGTVVFDDVALGGWLLWDQPTLVPVLDTRLEAYGSAHLHAYVDALAATPGWERTLAGWRVGAALLAVDAPLATALEQAGWHESARALGGRTTYVLLLPTRYAVPPS